MKPTVLAVTVGLFSLLVFIMGFLFEIINILWHYCFEIVTLYNFQRNPAPHNLRYSAFRKQEADILTWPFFKKYPSKMTNQKLILDQEKSIMNQKMYAVGEKELFSRTFSDNISISNPSKLPSEEDVLINLLKLDDISSIDNLELKNKRRDCDYRIKTGVEVKDHPLKKSISGFESSTKSHKSSIKDLNDFIGLNEMSSGSSVEVEVLSDEIRSVTDIEENLFNNSEYIRNTLMELKSEKNVKDRNKNKFCHSSTVGDAKCFNSSSDPKCKDLEDLKDFIDKINGLVNEENALEIVDGNLTLVTHPNVQTFKHSLMLAHKRESLKDLFFVEQNKYKYIRPLLNFTSEDGKLFKNKLKKLLPSISMIKSFKKPFAKESRSKLDVQQSTSKNPVSFESIESSDSKFDNKTNEFFNCNVVSPVVSTDWTNGKNNLQTSRERLELEVKKHQHTSDQIENESMGFVNFKNVDNHLKSDECLNDNQGINVENEFAFKEDDEFVTIPNQNDPLNFAKHEYVDDYLMSDECENGIQVNSNKSQEHPNHENRHCYNHKKNTDSEFDGIFNPNVTNPEQFHESGLISDQATKNEEDSEDDFNSSSHTNPIEQQYLQKYGKNNSEEQQQKQQRQRKRSGGGISNFRTDYRDKEKRTPAENFFDPFQVDPLSIQSDRRRSKKDTGQTDGWVDKQNKDVDLSEWNAGVECSRKFHQRETLSDESGFFARTNRTFTFNSKNLSSIFEHSTDNEEDNFESVELSSASQDGDDVKLLERSEKSFSDSFGHQAEVFWQNLSFNGVKLKSKLKAKMKNY